MFLLLILLLTAVLFAAVIIIRKVLIKVNQLSYQNRFLKAMRSLDIAALSTTEIEPLAEAIVNMIHQELGYTFAVVALVDYQARLIRRIAISIDPKGSQVLQKILPVQFKQQIVHFDNKNNLFNKVVAEKKSFVTEDLYDIQIGVLSREVSNKIMETYDLKSIFVHPLWSRNRVVGILEYASTVKKENIPQLELTIMNEFTSEVSRAFENAILYTQLRETSEALKIANVKLMELDRLKDEFVSVASHELRTPMTAIRSYAWMALHKSDIPLSQKLERYLVRTLMSAERLINLVNDMLNISRIESGRVEINPEPVDLIKLVKDAVDEAYYSKGLEKKVHFAILEERLPPVLADPEKLRQVMLNIVGNAVKFVPTEGTITVSFFTDGQVVEVSVKDTGPGIAKEDLAKLFKKFGRLDLSYTALSTSGGTGLGLFISKSLIELMHGRIWAHSEGVGRGATFSFSLPIASPAVLKNVEPFRVKAKGETKELEPVAI